MDRKLLPSKKDVKGAVVLLSGGLDSTVLTHLCVEEYGADKVVALMASYSQKQGLMEWSAALRTVEKLNIERKPLDLSFYGEMCSGVSANIKGGPDVPSIQEVLGHPQPLTYVPNRNAVLFMLAAAYAEVLSFNYVFTGIQRHDQYGYYDTTAAFVDSVNGVLAHNRTTQVKVVAPFSELSKYDELVLLKELRGDLSATKDSWTCYDPQLGQACGKCGACSERIAAFMKIGEPDPVPYAVDIPWKGGGNV